MNLLVLTLTVAIVGSVAAGDPPFPLRLAATARYIVHNNNWGNLASISTRDPNKGSPFLDVFSVSDGPVGNSTGVPYFYVTLQTGVVQDVMVNPNAALSFSEAQSGYCESKKWDPEDPRCAKVVLSGKIVTVPDNETDFAREALFSRHPAMAEWGKVHGFIFLKMEVKDVWVLAFFGPSHYISPEQYFKAKP